MARTIAWREEAHEDIAAIWEYIARDSPASADKVVAAIEQAVDGLVDFPYRFRMIPEFEDPERRETFVYKYRVMYRVEPTCIRILRVVHGQRLLVNVPGGFAEPSQEAYAAPEQFRRTLEHPMEGAADIAVKPQLSGKDEVRALLNRLPDSVTLEDIAYHLDVVIKVLEAEASHPSDDIPHEEVFREFEEKWRGQ
jgi:toxin ParE1/3/4